MPKLLSSSVSSYAALSAKVQHLEADMRPEQIEDVQWLLDNPFSHVWIDMGMGKTIIALTLILQLLLDWDTSHKILIIAPIKVALQTWPSEIALWGHVCFLRYTIIRAELQQDEIDQAAKDAYREVKDAAKTTLHTVSPSLYRGVNAKLAAVLMELSQLVEGDMRKAAVKAATRAAQEARASSTEAVKARMATSSAPIHIINREAIEWLVDFHGNKWPYDTVIVDESSCLRSHKSGRFKALKKVRSKIKRMHMMTGTPRPESYVDVFAPTWLLDQGVRLGSEITKFKERYFSYNQYSRELTPHEDTAELIADKLSDITVVRKNTYIPEPIVIPKPITLDGDSMARIIKFQRSFILSLPSGEQIEALNTANLSQKMLQLASGAIYDEKRVLHTLHTAKLEELDQIIEEADGKPIIVAYWFKSSLAKLRSHYPKGVLMGRQGDEVTDWNKGKIKLLFQHPASGGHGLNQQFGGHIMVFYDNPWPLELYQQLVARLNRPGQVERVLVYHLMTLGTRDEDVVPCLVDKRDAQEVLKKRVNELRLEYGH